MGSRFGQTRPRSLHAGCCPHPRELPLKGPTDARYLQFWPAHRCDRSEGVVSQVSRKSHSLPNTHRSALSLQEHLLFGCAGTKGFSHSSKALRSRMRSVDRDMRYVRGLLHGQHGKGLADPYWPTQMPAMQNRDSPFFVSSQLAYAFSGGDGVSANHQRSVALT